jgi:flavin-dependent dehydrogenase
MDDVVVVGGRCAGAPTAMLLSRAGLRVTLLERSRSLGDVVSGHMVKVAGTARLRRWGLLDDLLATGCPPLFSAALFLGDETFSMLRAEEDMPPALAPRRPVLDNLLLDAARDAGVDVRMGESVTGVLRDGERITGVATAHADYPTRLVVGADGRNSRVARLTGAATYHHIDPVTYAYYLYWRGSAIEELTASLETGLFVGMFPTHDDNALVFIQAPAEGFGAARADPLAHYLETLRARPRLWALLESAEPAERLRGGSDLPNFLRVSAGPGWVLVGDAGHHKDPVIARGIADAFRDADLVAELALAGWDGDLDESLAAYPPRRDVCALRLSQANVELARLDRDTFELGLLWRDMARLEAELDPAA